MPGLPSDADSKWRCYKRYCSTADKPPWVVHNYTDFKFISAVDQLAEFLSFRRDSGTGNYGDVANHRSAVCTALSTVFSCSSPAKDPIIERLIKSVKKKDPPQPRHPVDEPAWDPGVIIDYWLDKAHNHELPTREFALKSWSLWAIATFPRPSDGAKLVRSTLARHSGTGALKFQYFGTKELRLPVFSFQLSIHPDVQKKVCAVEAIEAYLSRTSGPAFKHGDRVWCSPTSGKDNRDPFALDAHCDDKVRCIIPLHRWFHPHGRCFQGHRRRLGPKTCPDDGTMAELACAQCLLQPCWLSAASAVDSTGLTQAQVNLPEPMCSGRTLCLSRLNMSVPSQAEDVWKHA